MVSSISGNEGNDKDLRVINTNNDDKTFKNNKEISLIKYILHGIISPPDKYWALNAQLRRWRAWQK